MFGHGKFWCGSGRGQTRRKGRSHSHCRLRFRTPQHRVATENWGSRGPAGQARRTTARKGRGHRSSSTRRWRPSAFHQYSGIHTFVLFGFHLQRLLNNKFIFNIRTKQQKNCQLLINAKNTKRKAKGYTQGSKFIYKCVRDSAHRIRQLIMCFWGKKKLLEF